VPTGTSALPGYDVPKNGYLVIYIMAKTVRRRPDGTPNEGSLGEMCMEYGAATAGRRLVRKCPHINAKAILLLVSRDVFCHTSKLINDFYLVDGGST
jgi:hypothetical protein